jgi:hypothetical protein
MTKHRPVRAKLRDQPRFEEELPLRTGNLEFLGQGFSITDNGLERGESNRQKLAFAFQHDGVLSDQPARSKPSNPSLVPTRRARRLECLGRRIKPIERLRTRDPQRASMIFEKRGDKRATQAVGTPRIMNEDLEVVSVITIEAVSRAEPNETLIVLHDLRDPGCDNSSAVDNRVKRIGAPSTTGRRTIFSSTMASARA